MADDRGPKTPLPEVPTEVPVTNSVPQPIDNPPNNSQAPSQDEVLDIDKKLLETIEARRARCNAKGAIARSRLALRASRNAQDPSKNSTQPAQDEESTTEPIEAFNDDQIGPEELLLKYGGSQVDAVPPDTHDFDDDDPSQWPEEIPMGDEADSSKFDDIQFKFNMIFEPTMEQRINFERAKREEQARKKRAAAREILSKEKAEQEHRQQDDPEDEEAIAKLLFVPQGPVKNTSQNGGGLNGKRAEKDLPQKPKRKQVNRLSAEEKRKSKKLGLDVALGRAGEKPKRSHHRKRKATDEAPETNKRPRKAAENEDDEDLQGLLFSNVSKEAHISAGMDALPTMTERNKVTALEKLIASLPSADQSGAKSDKRRILDATKKFTHSARSDGKGGWKIKGLQTTLYHYQLLGAAFMRDRENQGEAPLGGLLCDMMGFGKTIQALANIVDGRTVDPDDPVKTTLIVVPSHLVTHWVTQIEKHCERNAIGKVIKYHAKSRLESTSPEETTEILQTFGVIVTTYDEIRRSYPPMKLPKGAKSDDEITEWWNEFYNEQVGPLHRIKYLRIILDEGHVIKNHLSSVSIAVRALTAKYKWVLTGTPVLNYIEEFYPSFDFLGVPHIGSYDAFIRKYCSDETAQNRLKNLLRAFLYRRTHKSRLFTLPVISLPDIKEHVVETEFCGAERALYEAIVNAFIDTINGLISVDNPGLAQYRCFLTMILMLRMFSSHTLTAQNIVKRLLSKNIMEDLNRISKAEVETGDNCSMRITTWLKVLTKEITFSISPPQTNIPEQSSHELQGNVEELTNQFQQFMNQLHEDENWEERMNRTTCPRCDLLPDNPVITNCMHMYCEECYLLIEETDVGDSKKRFCVKCNSAIASAARCGYVEDIEIVESTSSAAAPVNQRQLSAKQKKKPKKKNKKKSNKNISMFNAITTTGTQNDEINNEPDNDDDDDEKDWVSVCGHNMPSAKLTKITEIISNWIAENPKVKVVIFTQFLPFVQILMGQCSVNNWPYACLTGKMNVGAREKSMEAFRKNEDIRILIASLKAGGTGLDMSVASKCIIVDLWWNEGVQQQAFCRLLRIGQKNEVEVVKLIVPQTIDDYMRNLQNYKTREIDATMGENALAGRDGMRQLFNMFAEVTECESGAILVRTKKK